MVFHIFTLNIVLSLISHLYLVLYCLYYLNHPFLELFQIGYKFLHFLLYL